MMPDAAPINEVLTITIKMPGDLSSSPDFNSNAVPHLISVFYIIKYYHNPDFVSDNQHHSPYRSGVDAFTLFRGGSRAAFTGAPPALRRAP